MTPLIDTLRTIRATRASQTGVVLDAERLALLLAEIDGLVVAPAPAPDYNDGEIHIWRGGKCPVHQDAVVMAWNRDGGFTEWAAKNVEWRWGKYGEPENDIIAFQVTRPHVDPVATEPAPLWEYWLNIEGDGSMFCFDSKEQATASVGVNAIRTAVHMRDVTK